MFYLRDVEARCLSKPNIPLMADDTVPHGITKGEFWERTGKVYSYLKMKNIGREDFVMICLPRGIQGVVAEFGILRAGAAFVLVEDTYAPERIEYIKKNCECKLVIDTKVFEEIQHLEPLEGYEEANEHDAAFAVYTSGTTGNPKGALHEYGNLDRMIMSILEKDVDRENRIIVDEDRFALAAPLNFVASVIIEIATLYTDAFMYILSYATVKNPLALGMFLVKNKINDTFLTPSYIRSMSKKPPMLTKCYVGSEPANGTYLEGIKIHNFYMMSESAFVVCHCILDKKYEEAPVGKSVFGHEVLLLSEDGNPVPDGEEGEVCFENKYFRGYIGLPEENAKAIRDGLYHTGDLGKKNENGDIVICGRLNDMVKINGNRVEPGEIENVGKRVLGTENVAVRIISDGNKAYICLYYTDNLKLEKDSTQKQMQKYLPYYMIPSFFIHIDEFPTTNTGKLSRKMLPEPDFASFLENYEAPRDEVETALCNGFQEVLKMQRVGIKDDFYELGGDSLGSIQLVTDAGLKGLTATDIFRGRTPEKIAELYKENRKNMSDIDPDVENAKQIKLPHPLSTEQLYMVDYQLYKPKSTMYNLNSFFKFDKNILDMERITEAVNAAAKNHAALQTRFFFNEEGEILQKYSPELYEEIKLEKVTEAELEEIKKKLIRPFRIIDHPLSRFRVFETEEAGYLFMDVHHTVFDGTSSKVFLNNFIKYYSGEDLVQGYYYYVINERNKLQNSDFYNESKEYFEKRYGGVDWVRHPHIDHESREDNVEEMFVPIPVTLEALKAIEEKYKVSPNAFFNVVAMIATAIYEKKPNIMLSWIYNGRVSEEELNTVGLLFRNLPVASKFKKEMTLNELYADVIEQINNGITHSCYPYIESNNRVVEDDFECVLFQGDLRNVEEVPGLLGEEELDNPYAASQNIMDLEILNTQEHGLVLMMDEAASLYEMSSIKRFAGIFATTAAVLGSCTENGNIQLKKIFRIVSSKSKEGGFLSENWWLKWME